MTHPCHRHLRPHAPLHRAPRPDPHAGLTTRSAAPAREEPPPGVSLAGALHACRSALVAARLSEVVVELELCGCGRSAIGAISFLRL